MGAARTAVTAAAPAAPVWRRESVRRTLTLAAGLGALAAGLVASFALGAVYVSPADVLDAIFGGADRVTRQIVWNLRIPRSLLACLVGANLAVAGALLQGIMRNPLAAPTTVGVSSGAGLAATAVLILAPGLPAYLPLLAFAGGMTAAVAVYLLSWKPAPWHLARAYDPGGRGGHHHARRAHHRPDDGVQRPGAAGGALDGRQPRGRGAGTTSGWYGRTV